MDDPDIIIPKEVSTADMLAMFRSVTITLLLLERAVLLLAGQVPDKQEQKEIHDSMMQARAMLDRLSKQQFALYGIEPNG